MEKTFPPVAGKSKISPRVETVKIWLWIREKWDKVGGKGGMEVKKEWRGIRRVEGEDGGTEREKERWKDGEGEGGIKGRKEMEGEKGGMKGRKG